MVLIFGYEIPIIAFWMVGIAIAIIIYFSIRDEEQKNNIRRFMKKNWIWVILILLWFMFRDYLGNWGNIPDMEVKGFFGWLFIKRGNSILLFSLLFYGLIKNFMYRERYLSTHAICDNRSGSCAEYTQKGEWIILNIGSCDADIPFYNGHETWVIPAAHFNKINNKPNSSKTQIVIQTNVQKCDMMEVPVECYQFLEFSQTYNKDEIYFGIFSIDEIDDYNKKKLTDDVGKKITPEDLITKLRNLNRMNNETQTMLKGKTSNIKRFVSDSNLIKRKAEGGSAFSIKTSDNTEV